MSEHSFVRDIPRARDTKSALWERAYAAFAQECERHNLGFVQLPRPYGGVRQPRFIEVENSRCCIIPSANVQTSETRRYMYAWIGESSLHDIEAVCFLLFVPEDLPRIWLVPPEPLRQLLGSRDRMQVTIPLHEPRKTHQGAYLNWDLYKDNWDIFSPRQ